MYLGYNFMTHDINYKSLLVFYLELEIIIPFDMSNLSLQDMEDHLLEKFMNRHGWFKGLILCFQLFDVREWFFFFFNISVGWVDDWVPPFITYKRWFNTKPWGRLLSKLRPSEDGFTVLVGSKCHIKCTLNSFDLVKLIIWFKYSHFVLINFQKVLNHKTSTLFYCWKNQKWANITNHWPTEITFKVNAKTTINKFTKW